MITAWQDLAKIRKTARTTTCESRLRTLSIRSLRKPQNWKTRTRLPGRVRSCWKQQSGKSPRPERTNRRASEAHKFWLVNLGSRCKLKKRECAQWTRGDLHPWPLASKTGTALSRAHSKEGSAKGRHRWDLNPRIPSVPGRWPRPLAYGAVT